MGAPTYWERKPDRDGWYLWRRSRTVTAQGSWRAVYVELDYAGLDCWEAGNPVEPPRGGWWLSITPAV